MNIDDVLAAVKELASGERKPLLRLAIQFSMLSTMQTLGKNCDLADMVRGFAETGLPVDREELWNYLRGANGILFSQHINGLYYAEYLDRTNQLDSLKFFPKGYLAQCDWRKRCLKLLRGHGINYKTASFAALIYEPEYCELVPVDRHVLARLGYDSDRSPQSKKKYLAIERQVMEERDASPWPNLPLAQWHWYKWEEYRQLVGASRSLTCESHERLSCRNY